MHARVLWLALLTFVTSAPPASAAFHLMKVVEVFAGTPASPNAHYVVIQMFASGQNFVSGHSIIVYNSANSVVGTYTFPGNVANGPDQAKILIATTEASGFFDLSADLVMNPTIPAAGGKICFDGSGDCVAWGNYSGPSAGVGPPFNPAGGIMPGKAIVRRLDIAGSPTTLDFNDDTDNSANDFRFGTPDPKNNTGQGGRIPPSTCGNNILEGLEGCDDGNTTSGDGCSATCELEGTVGVGETPATLVLYARPNPSRGDVTVFLSLPRAGFLEVGIHDVAGRRVRGLHGASLNAGPHRLVWDGRDDSGHPVDPGVYFVRVRGGDLRSSAVVVRLR